MPKLVSVIYPTNGKRKQHIRDSFSNLMYQTYQSLEVIILKEESYNLEDDIGFLFSQCKDKIRIINVPENCGSGYARNIGIENSRGSYISYLDDDDLWSNNYLEEQVKEIERIGCDLVYCNYHLRDQIYNDIDKQYVQHFISIPYNVKSFDREILLTEPFIHLSSVLHTRDITDIVKFTNIRSLNGWKFLISASKLFKFHNNSQTLVTVQHRLDRTNSLTSFGNETLRDWKLILKESQNELKDIASRKIQNIIFDNFTEKYKIKYKDEYNKLHTLFINRGFEFAYGYLLYLIKLKKIDYHICKIAYDICKLKGMEDLAKDMLYLSYWFNAEENVELKDYTPIYFKRENEQWNALL